MPSFRLRVLAALLLVGVSADVVSAQTDRRVGPASAEEDGGWLSLGVGVASEEQLSVAITGNLGRERFVQIGIHGSAEVLGRQGLGAYHVGVGRSDVGRRHRAAVAVGPALVSGVRQVDGEWDRFLTGGVLVNAQAFVTPIPEFGVGLYLFANGNPVKSGFGFGFAIIFEGNK